jgi:glycosyltransferase involved in cell wall biosynthesis
MGIPVCIAERIGACEEFPIAVGHEIVIVNDGSADHSVEICRD